MELFDIIERIETKQDFINFLELWNAELTSGSDEVENWPFERYLEGMGAFLENSTEDSLEKIDFTPSWQLFAKILYAAAIYE
jgi:hypothetical protein